VSYVYFLLKNLSKGNFTTKKWLILYDFFPKMAKYSDFDIEIESRKNGTYKFSYVLDDEFFSFFEKSLIEHGELKVELD